MDKLVSLASAVVDCNTNGTTGHSAADIVNERTPGVLERVMTAACPRVLWVVCSDGSVLIQGSDKDMTRGNFLPLAVYF